MTADEYITAKMAAGFDLHIHDGIWWQTLRRGYCKPAIPFEEVDPTIQRPALSRTLIGYAHRIPPGASQSGFWNYLVLRQPEISQVSLQALGGKRRNLIRKGLRLNTVRRIDDLSPHQKDMTDIVFSTAIRNRKGHPPEYYIEKSGEWWCYILKVAAYTEFWGAFHEDRMIAYMAIQAIGPRVIIDAAKSTTEYLNRCPNDALVFTILESCRDRQIVNEIIYGGWSLDKPTLNKFKESFGFVAHKIPFIRKMFFGLINCPLSAPGNVDD